MSKKETVRDLTHLGIGHPVWTYGKFPWDISNYAQGGGAWHWHAIRAENRACWIVGSPEWRLPKRIKEGDMRGIAHSVMSGRVAFSEEEKAVLGWALNNRYRLIRAMENATAEQMVEIAAIIGYPGPGEEDDR